MKRLKILLVLIFSLFVTDNLPQDAEASRRSDISRSENTLGPNLRQNTRAAPLIQLENAKASLGNALRVLVTKHKSVINKKSRSSKAYLKIDQVASLSEREININELIKLFLQEAEKLAGDNIESTIDFLSHANNALKSKPWEEYSGNTATIAGYLKFITSVSRAWFHTQPNSNVNALCVEANRENKIFLFVSGPVPFPDNDGAARLKNIIDISKKLVQCKKTVEVIDIHTLLGIESSDFKRFIHFLCNLDLNPQLGLNPQSLDDKERSKSKRFSLYLNNYLNNDMSSIEQAFKELRNNELTGDKFNNLGYFESAQDNEDFIVFCQEFLKILSFCEISENIDIGDNQALKVAIESIQSCRDTIIRFLHKKITPKECINELFLNDDNTMQSIIKLLHTEKILVTGLKCLELSDDLVQSLKYITNSRGEKQYILLEELYRKLFNKKNELSAIEKFIYNRLIKFHRVGNQLLVNRPMLKKRNIGLKLQKLLEKENLKFSNLQKAVSKKVRKIRKGQKYTKDVESSIIGKNIVLERIRAIRGSLSTPENNQGQAHLRTYYSSYRGHINFLKERCLAEFKVILNIYNIFISLKSTSLNMTSFVRVCDTCKPYIKLLIKDPMEHRIEYRQL